MGYVQRYTDASTYRVFTHMNHFSEKNNGLDDNGEPLRKRPCVEGRPRAERFRTFIALAERDARDRADTLIANLRVRGDHDKYDGDWDLEVSTANDDQLYESASDSCCSDATVWDNSQLRYERMRSGGRRRLYPPSRSGPSFRGPGSGSLIQDHASTFWASVTLIIMSAPV